MEKYTKKNLSEVSLSLPSSPLNEEDESAALNKEHKDITFAQFKLHFEEHLLSLRGCITRDIRGSEKNAGTPTERDSW